MILDQLIPLSEALRSGDLSVLDLVDLLEIRFGEEQPRVHAFVDEPGRFDRLRRQALELMMLHGDRTRRPPLFGVPVGVKDIFHVDGLPTTGGSALPIDELHGDEGPVVQRLREAGALIFGKTVTTEFAYFEPGPTRNPRQIEHTPGGSSSGSAAAVAAGLCPLALGTQTIGSVVRPASFCGIVGFKPSYERLSRDGVLPLAESLDHVGVFTTRVAGAERVMSLLFEDWRGVSTPRRATLGIPVGPYLDRADDTIRTAFERCCSGLREAGWSLIEVPAFEGIDDLEDRHRRIVAAEAARHHRRWYPRLAEAYRPRTVELLERGLTIDDDELESLRQRRHTLRRGLEQRLDESGLDAWWTPAAPGAAPHGLESTGDPIMNLPWSHAGLPSLALPAARDAEGLPLGMQLVGRFGADEDMFAWGSELETALQTIAEPELP